MRKILKSTSTLFKAASKPIFLASTFKVTPTIPTSTLLYKPTYKFSSSETAHKNISKSSFEGPGFYVQQFLTGCLSIYSYYIESNGQAFLIDPINEVKEYEEVLKSRNAELKGVFLSHYHADFVAGHFELEKKFNCKVYMGPTALESHKTTIATDGQEFRIGGIKLKLIHTPGHTGESSCILLTDVNGKQQALFSGDTLFLNQVGRPDLAVKSNLTKEDLAGMLFDSLQKLKSLDKDVRVYPGHGAGSSCGKAIGKGDFCMMGTQLQNNYGLTQTSKQKFVQTVLSQMPTPPQYFGHDAFINKFSPFDFEEVQKFVTNKLRAEQIPKMVEFDGVIVLDVRTLKQVEKGLIEGSIAIAFDGAFANWVGTVLSPKHYYVIYGDQKIAKESIKRLLRIGYTNIAGYCTDLLEEMGQHLTVYKPNITTVPKPPAGYTVLDVRKPPEWNKCHVDGAIHADLSTLPLQYKKLDKSKKYMIHCQSGYRARIAYSFLKNKGFDAMVLINEFEEFAKNGNKMVEA